MDISSKDYIFDVTRHTWEIIEMLNKLARDKMYVFRGYSKQNQIFPSIIRDEISYEEEERSFLVDFEKYGSAYFHVTSPIDFMSYAQHYGIPTRLLDFTYNPFIALSFALYRSKEKGNAAEDDDYYYIRYASTLDNICLPYIMHTNMHGRIERPVESMAEKAYRCIDNVKWTYENHAKITNLCPSYSNLELIFNLGDLPYFDYDSNKRKNEEDTQNLQNNIILFVTPSLSNQRIVMQQGLFMFPYTLDKEKHREIINENTFCIMIHKKHRDELLSYLDTVGFNAFRLMPDLGSICDAIKQKHKEKRIVTLG